LRADSPGHGGAGLHAPEADVQSVNLGVLPLNRRLPVSTEQRTSSEPVGMSQTCHNQTHAPQQRGGDVLIPAGRRPTKPWVAISSQSFGPEPRGRVSGRRLPCRGFKQGQLLLCSAMNADLLSDRFRQSSQISISVPNSTTCLAGTPKKVAEPLALCCRNAKRVSRHTAMPTISSLGMIVSRPT
jgi:hypothetical protein